MATVELAVGAVEDLDRLIAVLSLPPDTRSRVGRGLRVLERLPRLGAELHGRWSDLRFLLGPWRWLEAALDVLDRFPSADPTGDARRQVQAALQQLLRRIWPYLDDLNGAD